ncbi:MAG: hypothetical protein ACE5JU_21065 [Candidatus Binatia bacterium]
MPQRRDDPTINSQERLWRRVHPKQLYFDSETNEARVSSAAFSSRGELSVALASQTTIQDLLVNYPEHSVVEFDAGLARSAGCIVVRDPQPGDPAHALVCGSGTEGCLTGAQKKSIQQNARLVHISRVASEEDTGI